jgi:NDP-sugar pyrophosphorylase family protein
MQAAIIAGGLATRLGDLTKNLPKSMLLINGAPFIEYQFEFLKMGGVKDIVLCLGHLGRQIEEHCGDGRRFGIRIKYSYETEPLDTAGALKQAEPLLENSFFTLYGDSYVIMNLREMWSSFQRSNKLAAMSVYKNENRFDRSNTAIENCLVIEYNKNKWEQMAYIDYGVNLFRKDVLKLVPGAVPYSLGALFQQLIARRELLAYEVSERFYQIGSPEGLKECSRYLEGKP